MTSERIIKKNVLEIREYKISKYHIFSPFLSALLLMVNVAVAHFHPLHPPSPGPVPQVPLQVPEQLLGEDGDGGDH